LRLGDVVPDVTDEPVGTEVKSTLWVDVSWLVNVMVVPAVTVRVEGEKFAPVPAPDGMVTEAV